MSSSGHSLQGRERGRQSTGPQSQSGMYLRAIRYILLLSLVFLWLLSMVIFTEDAQNASFRQDAIFVYLSSVALVGLGIYATYHVRYYYLLLFSALLLLLMVYKLASASFRQSMLHSMLLHLPHLLVLLCACAFSCLAIFTC